MKMKFSELPFFIRNSYPNKAMDGQVYKFGEVQHSSNPYAYPEEKQMSGHFGVALRLGLTQYSKSTFVRDDGTVWQIFFTNFKEYEKVEVEK
jgi:hypothetical protein